MHHFFRAIHSYIENFYIICLDLDGGSKNLTEIFQKKNILRKRLINSHAPAANFKLAI